MNRIIKTFNTLEELKNSEFGELANSDKAFIYYKNISPGKLPDILVESLRQDPFNYLNYLYLSHRVSNLSNSGSYKRDLRLEKDILSREHEITRSNINNNSYRKVDIYNSLVIKYLKGLNERSDTIEGIMFRKIYDVSQLDNVSRYYRKHLKSLTKEDMDIYLEASIRINTSLSMMKAVNFLSAHLLTVNEIFMDFVNKYINSVKKESKSDVTSTKIKSVDSIINKLIPIRDISGFSKKWKEAEDFYLYTHKESKFRKEVPIGSILSYVEIRNPDSDEMKTLIENLFLRIITFRQVFSRPIDRMGPDPYMTRLFKSMKKEYSSKILDYFEEFILDKFSKKPKILNNILKLLIDSGILSIVGKKGWKSMEVHVFKEKSLRESYLKELKSNV